MAVFRGSILLLALCGSALSDPRGIPPRAHRSEYFVTSFTSSLGLGAELLSAARAARLFGGEISRQHIVVEVGFYSKTGAAFAVRHSDFVLRWHPSRVVVHPAALSGLGAAAGAVLPEGSTSRAVAGYLFFPAETGGQGCEIEYTGNGAWLTLPVRPWR